MNDRLSAPNATEQTNFCMQSPNRDAKTMEFKGSVKSETCVFTEKYTQFGRGITILRLRKPWNL